MGNAGMFFGGLPTEIDVRKLIDQFGKPDYGLIPYADIEAVLGMAWRTPRFRLILTNWRKHLRKELNLDTSMQPGEGVTVLRAGERIEVSHGDLKRAIRQTRKSYARIISVPTAELDAVSRTKYDHVVRHAQAVYQAGATHERELTHALKVHAPLPRIGPPIDIAT